MSLFSLEHKSKPLASRTHFAKRMMAFGLLTISILAFSWGIGVWGYMVYGQLGFIDAVLNAAMILTGMGPVNPMPTEAAKWFASLYAVYSGVAFLTTIGVFMAPMVHRLLHGLHLKEEEE